MIRKTRWLGLPVIARLSLFAHHQGPAILVTTKERLTYFDNTEVFGPQSTVNPTFKDWNQKHSKIILSLEHALKPFPRNPNELVLNLELGKNYSRETLLDTLISYGFERDGMPGVVVKGDTLTIYPDKEDENEVVRLGFFGNELDSIDHKESKLEKYLITPLEDIEVDESAWDSKLIESLEGQVFLDAPELFASELEGNPEGIAWFWEYCKEQKVLSFGRDSLDLEEANGEILPLNYYRGKLSEFANDAELWLKDGYSINLILRFERTGIYLREKVIDHLASEWVSKIKPRAGMIRLAVGGNTRGGYRDDKAKEIFISEDLLYSYQGLSRYKKLSGKSIQNTLQLSVDDYLIHPEHGIGRFLGLEPRKVMGITRDYLMLQYAGEGKLYLPVEQLAVLRRHPGTTDSPPQLSTIGTNEWARTRERARVNAQELASKLINIYAERQMSKGVALEALPEWGIKIAKSFPYKLTPDQAKAVEDVYADMAKPIPMDRLISGDVGFGKTEVAIRAAHHVVGHKKQVAMLVPTTVLAKQHYETFFDRFKDLPVVVEMLSRFSSSSEVRSTLQGLKTGSIDIVIGTHRLLSSDIVFNDLSLLIIDEEHRFGVAQKERIKSLKTNLDVLSLTATPIPRTLYMGLIGLRDVSQIMTPPKGRKPIQTVLQAYNPNTIRDAVMFELERHGKAFYIHDRIGSMGSRAMMLGRLVPEARIGVAHGQMSGEELEEVMLNFAEGAYDLLLSTTIVESGLDIATANTLIIERADRLGLAQLYQLRGRVGRRETEAWAYLLYPGKLTEQAQKRLFAIAELNDLGSGHLLAEKDMEIRGIGNLLGAEQHGHISAVSLEVYTEMLAEEVAKLKGEAKELPDVAIIDISIDAHLSPSYIADDEARIGFYGRLSETDSLVEIGKIRNEMRSSYGPLPKEVKAFIELIKIRLLAAQRKVSAIKEHMLDFEIIFQEDLNYNAQGIERLPYKVEVTKYPPGFSLKKRNLGEDALKAISEVLYQCT